MIEETPGGALKEKSFLVHRNSEEKKNLPPKKKVQTTLPIVPIVSILGSSNCTSFITSSMQNIQFSPPKRIHYTFHKEKNPLIENEILDPLKFVSKLRDFLKKLRRNQRISGRKLQKFILKMRKKNFYSIS